MDYSSAILDAANGNFISMRFVMQSTPPAAVNPSLQAGVEMINTARDAKGFVPYQGITDPAQMQLAMMRALLPPQVGMLLATVPPGSGILSMADGSYYLFCTEQKYVIVESAKTCRSLLMTLPVGMHRLMIGAYGWWDHSKYPAPPYLVEGPLLHTVCDINVQPGVITEVVAGRNSNFSKFSFNIVYH